MAAKTQRRTLRSKENDALIELLVSVRKEQGMTQRDLAKAMKWPHSLVGRIESGERRLDVVEFVAVARVLKQDPVELFARFVKG
ncbi:MAG TPA: helix-turn-helix transcriptional regulator [Steroidobacteraceae bacterium]|jgi:transcriptional regulator with XRE-family HTH domain